MIKNLIKGINNIEHWFLNNLDSVLFLLAILIVDITTYSFGITIGNYVVAVSFILIALILNKPTN